MIVDADGGLNVRSGPGTTFRKVDRLPDGTNVEVIETARSADGKQWAWVVPGQGWVSAEYLQEPAPASGRWRMAKSIARFIQQCNLHAPARAKTYDGTIGDAAHQATKSDHNPNALGVVTAVDITHDPARGMDCGEIVEALMKSKDPRIKYIIWRGRIMSSKVAPWTWRTYNGVNKHSAHLHLSVDPRPELYDDDRPWAI